MGWNEEDNSKQADSSSNSGANQAPVWLEQLLGSGGQGAFKLWIGVIALIWFLSGIVIVAPAEQVIVKRFGAYANTYEPGVHWVARGVEQTQRVNVKQVYHFNFKDLMLTKDENIVSVELAVQYQTGDAKSFLFNVRNPVVSLQQATASALRQVIGHTTLDETLTTGREKVRQQVQDALVEIMDIYKAGIFITDVALQPAKPPEEVTVAFDDAIKAREDEQRYINEAKAYAMKVQPVAEGRAARLVRAADAYRQKVVLDATADTADFLAILPEYTRSPEVTKDRLYLDTMEEVLTKTSKIYVDVKGGNNMLYLPLDKILAHQQKDMSPPLRQKPVTPQPMESVSDLAQYDINTTSQMTSRQGYSNE